MNELKNDEAEEFDEHELNPPPRKYRVSLKTKGIFLLCFFVGVGVYFYMIVERRVLQNRFRLQNQMAAVRLVPEPVPEFVAKDPQTMIEKKLVHQEGKWTLLNLWATWCPPCKKEMPSLEFLQQKYGERLHIIALSVDDAVDEVNNFILTNKPSFEVWWDKEKMVPKLFGVNKYPESFLISPQGVLSIQFSGPRDWASQGSIDYFDGILK